MVKKRWEKHDKRRRRNWSKNERVLCILNVVAFHSGTKENSTIHQTNTSNGSLHTALFSHESLKALHSQQRGLEDTLCRIRLYI